MLTSHARFVILALSLELIGAGQPQTAKSASAFEGVSAVNEQVHPVTAELIAEHASVQPGGRTRIGIRFEMEPGWHIYADPPGDAGLPTNIAWSSPSDATIGDLHWPTPESFVEEDMKTFGYSGVVIAYSPLTISAKQPTGQPLDLQAAVKWLACKQLCVPGHATLHFNLPVTESIPAFSAHAELFDLVAE